MSLPAPALLDERLVKYAQWYPGQSEALSTILDWLAGEKRYLGACLPTGSGKSLLAVLTSILSGSGTTILTATKGLQNQMAQDFQGVDAMEIKGQQNYECVLKAGATVEEGPCHHKVRCPFRSQGCHYYDHLEVAKKSRLLITNYHYWVAQTAWSKEGLNDPSLLVLDESHLAFQALEMVMGVKVDGPKNPQSWDEWKVWVRPRLKEAEDDLVTTTIDIAAGKQDRHTLALARMLKTKVRGYRTVMSADSSWVWERDPAGRYDIKPIWPSRYLHMLVGDVPKVLVMSATLTPKTMDLLGIPEDEREFTSAPSGFPPENTPVRHLWTTRMDRHADEVSMKILISQIDQLISRRLDRKGIIFTTAYHRARSITAGSRFSALMLSHDTKSVGQVVEQFRKLPPPAILVSPTVTTGWDFPERDCDYILIAKIPYPDTRPAVVKARMAQDKDWAAYEAMQTLVQSAGRGSRSASDRCEVIILDDNWSWFWKKYSHFAPDWFRARVLGSRSDQPTPLDIRTNTA